MKYFAKGFRCKLGLNFQPINLPIVSRQIYKQLQQWKQENGKN